MENEMYFTSRWFKKSGKYLSDLKRLFLFFLGSFWLLYVSEVNAQNAFVTLFAEKVALSEVLFQIEKQTGYHFLYSNKVVNVTQKVSINVKNVLIEKTLDQLFGGLGIDYVISDKQVVLKNVRKLHKEKISGVVMDAVTGEPLIGASILVVGENIGTVTNYDGKFTIEANGRSKLRISYLGYISHDVNINNRDLLTIKLSPDDKTLDEVVVVGYGTVRKRDLTGAVASVNIKELNKSVTSNAVSSLQGRVAGVTVESTGGSPGSSFHVKIRGTGTLNSNNPLYVVDDLLTDNIGAIDPNDIESMQILKDASAAAIYGSRAANGVVIITTKKGAAGGSLNINLNASYGITSPMKYLDLMTPDEYANAQYLAYRNAGKLLQLPQSLSLVYDSGGNPVGAEIATQYKDVNTDWQRELYRNASKRDINFSVSGGSKDATYNLSISNYAQDGNRISTDYQRTSVRLNTSLKKGIFKIGENLTLFTEKSNNPSNGSRNAAVEVLRQVPILPLHNDDNEGGWNGANASIFGYDGGNPIGIQRMHVNQSGSEKMFGNIYLEVRPVNGLILKSSFGVDTNFPHSYLYKPAYKISNTVSNQENWLQESRTRNVGWIWDNTVNYNKVIKNHSLGVMVGTSTQENQSRGINGVTADLPGNGAITVLSAGNNPGTPGGSASESALVSFFGRLTYSYADKYLFTANFRTDGSSKFAPGNQWGVFPSVSAAWRISQENFWKPVLPIVNDLKVRVSWGRLGNQTIANYGYTSQINSNSGYPLGIDPGQGANAGTLPVGMTIMNFNNPSQKWETTTTTGLGLDAELFNSRLSITFDIYKRDTHDMLTRIPIPLSSGSLSSPYFNIGSISNKGVEFTATYRHDAGDFKWEISGNIFAVRNKVEKLTGRSDETGYKSGGVESSVFTTTWTKVGYPIGAFFLYNNLGTYKDEKQIYKTDKSGNFIDANGQPTEDRDKRVPIISNRNVALGDLIFEDVSGPEGVPDGKIDENDLVYQGSAFPKFEGGINFTASYKNFDFSLFLTGVYGNKIFNANRWYMEGGTGDNYNMSRHMLKAWDAETNPNSDVQRIVLGDPASNVKSPSNLWLEDGSYLRLKNVQIGYTIPQVLTKKAYINKCRIYISGENLLTLTKYTGYDPEVGGDGLMARGVDHGGYPLYRTFLIGLQLGF